MGGTSQRRIGSLQDKPYNPNSSDPIGGRSQANAFMRNVTQDYDPTAYLAGPPIMGVTPSGPQDPRIVSPEEWGQPG